MKRTTLVALLIGDIALPTLARSPLFLDGTDRAGVGYRGNGKGAAFADIDNDGRWDLLVSNKGGGNVLYHNNGDGTFTNITDKVGGNIRDSGYCMGSVFFDYDNDGWVDLFIPKGGRYEIESNRLLRNVKGKFVDVTAKAGVGAKEFTYAGAVADYNNDGYLDLYCANYDSCIRRAVELLGLGSDALRLLPPDGDLRMDPAVLAHAVAEDRAAGRLPLCVVATAGTVNTGAIDPLAAIRDVARREDLWFHVDGAYGAIGAALPELAARYAGLGEADSLTVDPHKWLYVSYEAGAVLVRDRHALTRAFATNADYLEVQETDYFSGPLWFHQQGPQLSRAFRALKVWCVMRELGLEGFHTLWRGDLAVAAELRRLVASHPRLEQVGPSDLSIVCFRYVPRAGNADALNRRLVNAVQQDGRVFLSGTNVRGVACLRAAILNFRSTLDDARRAVELVAELGARLE